MDEEELNELKSEREEVISEKEIVLEKEMVVDDVGCIHKILPPVPSWLVTPLVKEVCVDPQFDEIDNPGGWNKFTYRNT